VRAALAGLDPAEAAATLQAGGTLQFEVAGETVELDRDEVLIQTESRGGLAVASDKGITVAVDTTLTPELIQEGYARDLVRAINTMRKDIGLALDDRVDLYYEAVGEPAEALVNFGDYVKLETLALSLNPGQLERAQERQTFDIDGHQVIVGLKRADS
jgi:isoleucyl-tRNA synthetase